MKVKLVSAVLLVFLVVGVPTAQAFHWRMRYGQAKHSSRQFAIDLCERNSECTGFGVGQCYRITDSRFDCAIGLFSPGAERGEEIECDTVLHWGVGYSGYVELKNRGPFHCRSF
jgi:hypothetical protein